MALVKLGPFSSGADNVSPDFSLPKNQYGQQIAARRIVNAEVQNSGHPRRRQGYTAVQAFSGAHSLWSDGVRTLLVRDSVLYRVTSFDPYSETLVKLLTSNARMSYVSVAGEVYCSNGTDAGRLSASHIWSPHALPVPASCSLSTSTGTLLAGKYQVAITYANGSSEEGGAKHAAIELASAGSIVVTLPTASVGATHINVYLTDMNGGVPKYHSQVAVGTATVTLNALATGKTLQTAYLEPLPAGRFFYYNGRLLSAVGSRLYYSSAYNLGLHDPVDGFIGFRSDVSTVVPSQNGVYVAADVTHWLSGRDISKLEGITDVLPYGATAWTEFIVPNQPTVGWYGEKGLVLADLSGGVKAVQEDRYAASTSPTGSSLVVHRDGLRAVVVTLDTPTASPLART